MGTENRGKVTHRFGYNLPTPILSELINQDAIAVLKDHNGDIEASFEELYFQQHGSIPDFPDKSLWEVTLNQLRQELCGDDSFRTKVQEYSKNPGSTPLLTGLIVYLVGLAGLPLDPAIATVVVLYILKIGLNIFCQYTEPSDSKSLPGE
ncbi:hypothetical protein [Coleofasciculus sp. B1-GNL1-01]|uniref:hypothetical protein n=1 Tax=Coleofasciculus sp. B1-GNL1-01 TaxID=3068484 RepID=UPI004064BAA2